MELGSIEVLLLITLLDSLSTGLVIPLLAPDILGLGGLQITLGFLITGIFVANSFSKDFLIRFEHGKKLAIIISLSFSLFVYVILIANLSYHIVLFCGWFHALSNRVCDYAKEYVAQVKQGQKTKIFALFDLMSMVGIVIGPICSGYIFAYKNDVRYNATVSAFLTYLNLLLLQLVENDRPDPDNPPAKPNTIHDAVTQFKSLIEINYLEFWDSVILRICYVSSFTIFFTQFAVLISNSYHLDTVTIGYTVSYQNLILIACNCFAPFIQKAMLKDDHVQQIFEYTLLVCSLTLVWIYYAPSHRIYLISVVPLFVSHAVTDNVWHSLIVEVDGEELDANKAITNTVGMAVPILFGHLLDKRGPAAFKMFAVLPPVVCVYYLKQNFFNSNVRFIVEKISEKALQLKRRAEESGDLDKKVKKKKKKIEVESSDDEEEKPKKKQKKKKKKKKVKEEDDDKGDEVEKDPSEKERKKKKQGEEDELKDGSEDALGDTENAEEQIKESDDVKKEEREKREEGEYDDEDEEDTENKKSVDSGDTGENEAAVEKSEASENDASIKSENASEVKDNTDEVHEESKSEEIKAEISEEASKNENKKEEISEEAFKNEDKKEEEEAIPDEDNKEELATDNDEKPPEEVKEDNEEVGKAEETPDSGDQPKEEVEAPVQVAADEEQANADETTTEQE